MPRTKISEFSVTPGDNTDIDGINIAEGCAPSGINDAIRELMAQLKDFQSGAAGDNITVVGTLAAKGTSSSGADLKLYEDTDNGTNYVGFIAPASIASNVQWTLPSADGSSGQALQTNGSGTLSFATLGISAGGTGQTTANAAFNALAPSQTSNAGRYLKTDGTNTSWDLLDISTADITGTLPVANGGTGITSFGTGVATALGINVGSSGAFVTNGGALGTPSSGTVTNLTGTASININGTVGATTPNTGSFTTLTTSSTVTINGGTANGVAYLNGSKVLTTGSALTFDGTTLSALTSGTSVYFSGGDSSVGRRLQLYATTTTNTGDTQNINALGSTGVLAFALNSSEQMRLTSTGLGIGTSSPAYKLDVSGASVNNPTGGAGSRAVLRIADTTAVAANNGGGILFRGVYTGTTQVDASGIQAYKANATDGDYSYGLAFATRTNGSDIAVNMRLDSSGNLGLGVTPSAWDGTYKALELNNGVSLWAQTNIPSAWLSSNAILQTAGWRYKSTAAASGYNQSGGTHAWFTAPSGTAGNAISFTQAMTLDASGNLSIGVTTSSARLHLAKTGGVALRLDDLSTNYWEISNDSNLIFNRGGTERARITSGGEFIVGNSVANGKLDVYKSVGYNADAALYSAIGINDNAVNNNAVHYWRTGLTGSATGQSYVFQTLARTESTWVERARITSGGDLLVGTADAGATTGVGVKTLYSATIPSMHTVFNTAGGGNAYHLYNTNATNNGYRFYVGVNGGISNYQANNTNLSDVRLKKDIADASNYLDKICAIPVRTFRYKDQSDDALNLGVIAQEVEAIAPELVNNDGFGETPDDSIPLKTIYQTDLQYALMKALQELKAELDTVKAELATLKGNP